MPDFSALFVRAREEQMRTWSDQIVSLIDNAEPGYKIKVPLDSPDLEKIEKNGFVTFTFNRHALHHASEMVNVRKWVMSKVLRQEFGDRQTLDMNVTYEDKDDDELIAEFRMAMEQAGVTFDQLAIMMDEKGSKE